MSEHEARVMARILGEDVYVREDRPEELIWSDGDHTDDGVPNVQIMYCFETECWYLFARDGMYNNPTGYRVEAYSQAQLKVELEKLKIWARALACDMS